MRVLFVCPFVPWPLVTGGKIRTFHLIKEAAVHTEIHLRVIREPEPDGGAGATAEAEEALREHCASVELFDRTRPGAVRRLALPKLERWFHSSSLHEHVRGELATGRLRLVHLDELLLARIVPRGREIPVIQHHHKLDTVLYGSLAASGATRAFDLWKLRRLEAESARRYRHHLLCSHGDADILRERYGALDIGIVPSGFDPDHFVTSSPPIPREPDRLLFLGSMDYGPNVDAVQHFTSDVLPKLHVRRPELVLEIVGRAPTPEVQALSSETVRVIGEVPDVLPYLERAGALVVPLRIGGGTRLKIVEALALGTPVVSTRVGAEGLGLEHEQQLLLADSPESFADATLRLVEDRATAERLGESGRRVVHERYRWSALAEDLVDYWERVAFSGALTPSH